MKRSVAALATVSLLCTAPVRAQAPAEPPPAEKPSGADVTAGKPLPSVRDDKRRTMKSYWNNLAYNFLGVVTTGNHEPLLVTAALTAPAFMWDDEGIKYFEQHPHPDFADIGSVLGGTIAVAGLTIGAFSVGRLSSGNRPRAASYDMSQAIIVNQVWTQALKLATQRERPDGSNSVSFPSGHASNAFTAATVLSRHYPRLAVPSYGLATYIAVSRMAANKHHFSDIVAGAGFGYGVGRVVTRRNSREPDAPAAAPATSLTVVPDSGPAGDGTGARLVFSF